MTISIIVAAADNNVIGKDNQLIWSLSNDMKHFRALTMGNPIIMGRKTFESIGRALPGRKNIVLTRDMDYSKPDCIVVHNIEEALEAAGDSNEVFIIGGDQLYHQFWEMADRLYLTRVHISPQGDVIIPPVDPHHWQEKNRMFYRADEKNQYDHSIILYVKKA